MSDTLAEGTRILAADPFEEKLLAECRILRAVEGGYLVSNLAGDLYLTRSDGVIVIDNDLALALAGWA